MNGPSESVDSTVPATLDLDQTRALFRQGQIVEQTKPNEFRVCGGGAPRYVAKDHLNTLESLGEIKSWTPMCGRRWKVAELPAISQTDISTPLEDQS